MTDFKTFDESRPYGTSPDDEDAINEDIRMVLENVRALRPEELEAFVFAAKLKGQETGLVAVVGDGAITEQCVYNLLAEIQAMLERFSGLSH